MSELARGDEFYFQWHITERCNERCAHCYHASYTSNNELKLRELIAALTEMEKALRVWNRVGTFSLTGGEPFLRRAELFGLAERLDASDRVAYYDILTNGSLISEDDLIALCGFRKLRRVQLSLEGPSADVNDAIRGPGSFARTVRTIDRLKDAGLQVAVMMTLNRQNVHTLSAMLDLLASHRVDAFSVERFIPEGSGMALAQAALTREEVKQAFEALHALGVRERRLRVLMYRPLFAIIDHRDPHVGAMCSAGTNALTIMHDGTVYPCRRLPIPLGNILTDGLFKIWYDSEVLWKIRDPSNLERCAGCDLLPVCRGCRAMAYFATGDYCAVDPHCWKDVPCTA